jgi:Transposase IS66 family
MAGSHVVTVRTPDERLVWYAATPSRSSEAIRGLGVMNGYHGILVRDDYAGWAQFDIQLAGVQQCCQHLSRHLKGVHALHPHWQQWAEEARQALSEAHRAVRDAIAARQAALDPEMLTGLRQRHEQAVH